MQTSIFAKTRGMGNFDRFIKKELKGAAKKEAFKQEKRSAKKERENFFIEKKQKERALKKETLPPPVSQKAAFPKAAKPAKSTANKGVKLGGSNGPSQKPFSPAPSIQKTPEADMPLNKVIAYGGICSRRDAVALIKEGRVKVNGLVVLEPGFKVKAEDEVFANGKKVVRSTNLVYILLNKPKDFVTTVSDDKGRKTVLDIVKSATEERIYPVGRLDRNTTGVLLLTNDGDLAQQLSHPKFEVRKIYEVKLDKPVTKAHLDMLVSGITLEDGWIVADAAAFPYDDPSIVGVEIHSGRNRIVRRMFEHLGYDVKGLDRVMYANLTKKNVDRGKWRFLSEKEIRLLKYFNKAKHHTS